MKNGIHELVYEGTEWTDVTQDRDRWRVHVNAVMNLGVPIMQRIS